MFWKGRLGTILTAGFTAAMPHPPSPSRLSRQYVCRPDKARRPLRRCRVPRRHSRSWPMRSQEAWSRPLPIRKASVIFGRYLCPRFHTTSGDERACWAGTSDTQRPHAWKAPGKRCARPQAPEIPIGACRQSESDKCDKELGLVAADLGKVPPRASNRSNAQDSDALLE